MRRHPVYSFCYIVVIILLLHLCNWFQLLYCKVYFLPGWKFLVHESASFFNNSFDELFHIQNIKKVTIHNHTRLLYNLLPCVDFSLDVRMPCFWRLNRSSNVIIQTSKDITHFSHYQIPLKSYIYVKWKSNVPKQEVFNQEVKHNLFVDWNRLQ